MKLWKEKRQKYFQVWNWRLKESQRVDLITIGVDKKQWSWMRSRDMSRTLAQRLCTWADEIERMSRDPIFTACMVVRMQVSLAYCWPSSRDMIKYIIFKNLRRLFGSILKADTNRFWMSIPSIKGHRFYTSSRNLVMTARYFGGDFSDEDRFWKLAP